MNPEKEVHLEDREGREDPANSGSEAGEEAASGLLAPRGRRHLGRRSRGGGAALPDPLLGVETAQVARRQALDRQEPGGVVLGGLPPSASWS